jgi:phosphonate transport system permease protein
MRQWENRYTRSLGCFAALAVFALATQQVVINGAVWQQLDSVREILKRGYQLFKLDWSGLSNLLGPLIEVVVMAFCGAVVGGLLALGTIFLAKRMASVQRPFFLDLLRWLLASCGAVHELVWAFLLMSLIGPGLVAAVLALGLASVRRMVCQLGGATVGREISPSAGPEAGGSARVLSARTIKLFLSEGADNLGRAAVLGLVGVGGLGLEFYRNLVTDNFGASTVTLLVALGLIAAGQALNYSIAARPLQMWNGVNAPTPDRDVLLSHLMAFRPLGPGPAYGLLTAISGAIVVLILHAIGVFAEPQVISSDLQFREADLAAGLVWAVSETLQTLLVAVTLGTLAVALLVRLASVRIVRLQGLFKFASRAIVVVALLVPVMYSVLLCRTVIGVGPLTGVVALSMGAVGLIGRELVFPRAVDQSTGKQGRALPLRAYAGFAIDAFARLLPAATIMGFFGAGGIGWLLKLTMQHGEPSQSLSVLIIIVALMLLSQTGYESLRRRWMNRELTGSSFTNAERRQS